jgi:hypothetical protein
MTAEECTCPRVEGAHYHVTQAVNRDLGIVLGICGHWWQAKAVPEVMAIDCPTCGRPPSVFIGCWDETWPSPEPAWNESEE